MQWNGPKNLQTFLKRNAIFEAKKSLLSDGVNVWKKRGEVDFLIQMGSWDGAESTDLVGLFLLDKMKHLGVSIGLYCDDGLIISYKTNRQNEKLKIILLQSSTSMG